MAGIAMFIFKEGSRNAFNNDRSEGCFNVNYQKIFNLRLPHMDTVDDVMHLLKENEASFIAQFTICNIRQPQGIAPTMEILETM